MLSALARRTEAGFHVPLGQSSHGLPTGPSIACLSAGSICLFPPILTAPCQTVKTEGQAPLCVPKAVVWQVRGLGFAELCFSFWVSSAITGSSLRPLGNRRKESHETMEVLLVGYRGVSVISLPLLTCQLDLSHWKVKRLNTPVVTFVLNVPCAFCSFTVTVLKTIPSLPYPA